MTKVMCVDLTPVGTTSPPSSGIPYSSLVSRRCDDDGDMLVINASKHTANPEGHYVQMSQKEVIK